MIAIFGMMRILSLSRHLSYTNKFIHLVTIMPQLQELKKSI